MTDVPFLSVVIPTYNEESRIPSTLETVTGYLAKQDYTSEVIVVDDGSADDTRAVGRAFIAIRDDDVAAETMGVNLAYYKTLSFAISAFYAGVGGGLYAYVLRFIEPELFNLVLSIFFLAFIVVGGLGSIMGAIAGACLISWLDLTLRHILEVPFLGDWLEVLSDSYFSITGVSNIQFIILGLIMILVMVFEPLGIYGIWLRIKKFWMTWPF